MSEATSRHYGQEQLPDFYRMDADGQNLRVAWRADGTHIGPCIAGDSTYGSGKALVISGDEAYFIGLNRYHQEIYRLSADMPSRNSPRSADTPRCSTGWARRSTLPRSSRTG